MLSISINLTNYHKKNVEISQVEDKEEEEEEEDEGEEVEN